VDSNSGPKILPRTKNLDRSAINLSQFVWSKFKPYPHDKQWSSRIASSAARSKVEVKLM